jgi:hypothetical protein
MMKLLKGVMVLLFHYRSTVIAIGKLENIPLPDVRERIGVGQER